VNLRRLDLGVASKYIIIQGQLQPLAVVDLYGLIKGLFIEGVFYGGLLFILVSTPPSLRACFHLVCIRVQN
jgi:hypothetical protein